MKRTFDAALLNEAAAKARPGWESQTYTNVLANPENVGLVNEHGGFVCVKQSVGLFDVHVDFLPEGFGPETLAAGLEGLAYMFLRTEALELSARVPTEKRAVLAYIERLGFKPKFERETPVGLTRFFGLTFEEWREGNESLVESGASFADKANLPVMDSHNLAALGALVAGAESGTVSKSVWLYNKWAIICGEPPVRLVALLPPILAFGNIIVSFSPMEILQ